MSQLYITGQLAYALISGMVLSITVNVLLILIIGYLLSEKKKHDQAGKFRRNLKIARKKFIKRRRHEHDFHSQGLQR